MRTHQTSRRIEYRHLTAQGIIAKVVEGSIHIGGNTLASHGIVRRGLRGTPTGLHLFDGADVGGERGGSIRRALHRHPGA